MFHIDCFRENVKKFRIAKGYSQHGLAAALRVSPQTVSKWECGRGVPDIENLCLLSGLLGVSLDALIGNAVSKKRIFLGIDGGGSKTEFVLFSEDGAVLARTKRSACSPTIIGVEASAEVLCDGIREMLSLHSDISAIFAGCAGFYTDRNGEKVKAILKKRYPQIAISCRSDILNVIYSAPHEESCIAAICGTGVSIFLYERDELSLFTGWGYMFDRFGSGYAIGRDALTAVLEANVGLSSQTMLTELVKEKMEMPIEEAVGEIYRRGVSYVASFAPCVFRAYEQGDGVAKRILEENAAQFAALIEKAAKRMPSAATVILSGGLVQGNAVFYDMLRERLDARIALVVPSVPQCIGACLAAASLGGADPDSVRKSLIESYNRFD